MFAFVTIVMFALVTIALGFSIDTLGSINTIVVVITCVEHINRHARHHHGNRIISISVCYFIVIVVILHTWHRTSPSPPEISIRVPLLVFALSIIVIAIEVVIGYRGVARRRLHRRGHHPHNFRHHHSATLVVVSRLGPCDYFAIDCGGVQAILLVSAWNVLAGLSAHLLRDIRVCGEGQRLVRRH